MWGDQYHSLKLDANRVRWMIRHHKVLNTEDKQVYAVFDYCGGELKSRRKAK